MAKELALFTLITMGLSIISKALGFFRDIVLVSKLGAGSSTDIYYGAMNIVDFVILFSGLNAMKSVTTSMYTKERDLLERKNIFYSALLSGIGGYGVLLVLLVTLLAPLLVKVFLPGFSGEATTTAAHYLQLLSFIILFRSLYFILGNILAVEKKFVSQNVFMPAINLLILTIIWITPVEKVVNHMIYAMVIGHGVAVLLQYFILSKKCSIVLKYFRERLEEINGYYKSFVRTATPLLFVTTTFALASSTDKIIASFFKDGAITSLNIASMIGFLPLQFILVPVGNVLFPHFSKLYNTGNIKKLQSDYSVSQGLVAVVFIPITAFLFYYGKDIITFAFMSDKFTAGNVSTVSQFLSVYSLALIFNAFYYLTSFMFQGAQKNKVIGKIGLIGYVTNIACSIILSYLLKSPIGIAIGTLCAFIIFASLAHKNVSKEFGFTLDKRVYFLIALTLTISSTSVWLVSLLPLHFENMLITIIVRGGTFLLVIGGLSWLFMHRTIKGMMTNDRKE